MPNALAIVPTESDDVSRNDRGPAHEATGTIYDLDVRPVTIGVVGLGYWGPNIVRNFNELPEAEVVWICDSDEERLRAANRRFRGIEATTSVEDLLDSDEIEAVAIATPVSTHGPLAARALDAGKHVFVEKPLAASSGEASELVALARRLNRVLMPGHTFLYSPAVTLIRELIRAGELGEIYFVSMSRVNLGLHQPDVSVVWDLGPHDFSILRYWLDEMPSHVTALSRSCILPGVPDVAFVSLEFAAGTIAHVELAWLAPSKLRRTAIIGEKKMIVYDDTSNEPVRLFDAGVNVPTPETFGEYRLSYRSGDIVSINVPPDEPLSLQARDFCRAVRTGSTPRSSAELGVEVVRLVEAVDLSLQQRIRTGLTGPAVEGLPERP